MPENIPDKIGVFDSGIGGLTVVREIKKEIPGASIIYFGDTARVPYGTKSRETIIRFAVEDVDFLLKKGVRIVISACFSVSSNALPELKKRFNIPMMGMITPGVKAAAGKGYRKIGVIGTQATIDSGSFKAELKKVDKRIKIFSKPCPLFVPLAEEGWISGDIPEKVVKEYLTSLKNEKVEAIILGCTHYPLLSPVIEDFMGENVDVIEPGRELAREVQSLFKEKKWEIDGDGEIEIFLSDMPRSFKKIAENFMCESLSGVNLVNFE